MNYRHDFHAGNFADVMKHVVLTRVIEYLKLKDKPFRVIDTHAGSGVYDLSADPAMRTGEWKAGIGRLMVGAIRPDAAGLLRPYLDLVAAELDASRYPGSPLIVRRLLRRSDRLTALELHPQAAAALAGLFEGDVQVRVIELDGWLSLGAHVPPKERRGLVLVDPPFEQPGEFGRLVEGLRRAWRRWPQGIYALWYPIKDRAAVASFCRDVVKLEIPRILDIRLEVRASCDTPRLDGSGMMLVNPPYTLEREMQTVLPVLAERMADPGQGRWSTVWLAGEAA